LEHAFASVAIFLKEEDIGLYTIKTIDDPRTLNKIVYLRPPANILSVNELVSLWESKIGAKLEREYVAEEDMIELIKSKLLQSAI
jgi:type IV secretory pathway protease TraF